MSELSDALSRALKSITPDDRGRVVAAPKGLPLVVDVGTRSIIEAIRTVAANPNHHSTVIFFDDDPANATRPDTVDPNQEEIRRILEMSADRPLRIRPDTSEE